MTPEDAVAVIEALGAAFAAGSVEAVVGRFAPEGDVMYAGSEWGEVAVGLPALRQVLTELFARDERYSWRCDSVYAVACGVGFAVLADATLFVDPWPHDPDVGRQTVPYRVSGLLEGHEGDWRWRVCHGSEPVSPAATVAGPLGTDQPRPTVPRG